MSSAHEVLSEVHGLLLQQRNPFSRVTRPLTVEIEALSRVELTLRPGIVPF